MIKLITEVNEIRLINFLHLHVKTCASSIGVVVGFDDSMLFLDDLLIGSGSDTHIHGKGNLGAFYTTVQIS